MNTTKFHSEYKFTTEWKLCDNQSQLLELQRMCPAALGCVDPCGVYIRVTQNIRKLRHVLLYRIVRPCKQMPQIVREYFARRYIRLRT